MDLFSISNTNFSDFQSLFPRHQQEKSNPLLADRFDTIPYIPNLGA